jgi:peroxiredoxin
MSKVELNASAPDFSLADFQGNQIRLSDYKDQSNVLLVFNRTFT